MSRVLFRGFIDIEPKSKIRARKGKYNNWYNPNEKKEETLQLLFLAGRLGPISEGPVRIIITYFLPLLKKEEKLWEKKGVEPHDFAYTRKPDSDNLNKLVFDSCTGVIYKDDIQIIEKHIYKKNAKDGKVGYEILIEELDF